MLMAGLDGIQNKIHPGDAMDKNLYDLPPAELPKCRPCAARCARRSTASRPTTSSCIKGDVFTADQIDSYLELKWEEVYAWEHHPHPIEYKMYYAI